MRKFLFIVVAISFYIAACTKIESTNIGTGLIPPVDGINTFDTLLDVYTNTFLDTFGLHAKVYKNDEHVIGVINNDPLFGKTTAIAYFELKPTYYKFSFPSHATLLADSAVLILSYKGTFGDTTAARVVQNWEVYELADTLRKDSIYDVSTKLALGSQLATQAIDPNILADSVRTDLEKAKNQIRIKLSTPFAEKLIKTFDTSSANNGAYDNDTMFRKNFKGFAVKPQDGSAGNALIRINLLDTNTKLALFYNYKKEDTSTIRTKEVSYFRFSTGAYTQISGSSNYIKREYSGSEVDAKFNTNVNDSVLYIQTTPGTFATIKIPTLASFPNALIHRAELVATQVPEANRLHEQLTAPTFLLLSRFDSVNRVKRNIPNDLIISGGQDNFSTFGGYTIDRTDGVYLLKSYNFDLSRYVQGVVTRKDSTFTLRLSAPTNDSLIYTSPYPSNVYGGLYYVLPTIANTTANGRIKIGGGGMADPRYRMRLRIIYSKI